jgi:hypothetical protein
LCHRNPCTKVANYRCNQNNLYKFRFHVTSSQLRFAHLDETILEMVYGKSSALRSSQGWGFKKYKGWPMCCEPPVQHNSDVEENQHNGCPTAVSHPFNAPNLRKENN